MKSKLPQKKIQLVSFDGGYKSDSLLQSPDRYRNLKSKNIHQNVISRGSGLSYAAASFGESSISISTQHFNRILGFNKEKNEVEVESGICLRDLFNFLYEQKSYLKIQPGCSYITVGGCIAADVHGKNPFQDGTFIGQVVSIKLFHPSHGVLELSRELNSELFFLTCGGYGLTGIILSAVLKASKLHSSNVLTKLIYFDSLAEGVNLLNTLSPHNDFVYSWNDFSGGILTAGKGIIFKGNIERDRVFNNLDIDQKIIFPDRRPHLKFNMFKAFLPTALNMLYKSKNHRDKLIVNTIFDSLYAAEKNFIYYRLHGLIGLHEYQAIVPIDRFDEYCHEVKKLSIQYGTPITLAAMKKFQGARSNLRFDGMGIGLTINIPRGFKSSEMLSKVDGVLVSLGGWPNLIKDSRLPQSVVEATYPEYFSFKKKLLQFDSKRIFKSELSNRLGL